MAVQLLDDLITLVDSSSSKNEPSLNDHNCPIISQTIPQQRFVNGVAFPLVLSPRDANFTLTQFIRWLQNSTTLIENLMARHGAILFRGFPVQNAHDFSRVVSNSGYDEFPYIAGAAVRRTLAPRVLTSNESPSSEKIFFHHELSQSPKIPDYVIFYCDVPAQRGGETPILLSWEFYERFAKEEPEFVKQCANGIHYIRVLPAEDDSSSRIGRGWKSTYLCETREEAEDKMRDLGFSWEWLADGSLWTKSPLLAGVRVDKRTGKTVFFNSAIASAAGNTDSRNVCHKSVVFEDGTEFPRPQVERALELMDEVEVAFAWEKGDFMILDNWQVMHSRNAFEGPRVIGASMASRPQYLS